MIFDKCGKTIQWENDDLFNKWCQENQVFTCKSMKLNPYQIPHVKINSK